VTIAMQVSTQAGICAPGVTAHMYCGPTSMGAQVMGVALEDYAGMWWIPGAAVGANSYALSVLHDQTGIILDGHDLGPLLGHFQLVLDPVNALTPVHIVQSSRDTMFVASTVVMEGKSVALCSAFIAPPAPMYYCGEPGMPGIGDATAPMNSVHVGMTPADYTIGLTVIAVRITVESVQAVQASREGVDVADEIVGLYLGPQPEDVAMEAVPDLVEGTMRLGLTEGPVEIELGGGTTYAHRRVVLGRDVDGNVSVETVERSFSRFTRQTADGVEHGESNPYEGHPPPVRPLNIGLGMGIVDPPPERYRSL
jgi:hypothetical protein